jgi:hypothetical protein
MSEQHFLDLVGATNLIPDKIVLKWRFILVRKKQDGKD